MVFISGISATLDVVYAVDTSSDVSEKILKRMKSFIANSLSVYSISSSQTTRVGILQYGNGAMVQLFLKDGFQKLSITNSINELKLTGGPRQMQEAIRKVSSDMFTASAGSRSDSEKVLVLITTGRNYPLGKSDLPKAANKLREKGAKVIVVTIGDENPDATDIVNNPDKIIKGDSEMLNEIIGELEKEIGKSIGKFVLELLTGNANVQQNIFIATFTYCIKKKILFFFVNAVNIFPTFFILQKGILTN